MENVKDSFLPDPVRFGAMKNWALSLVVSHFVGLFFGCPCIFFILFSMKGISRTFFKV